MKITRPLFLGLFLFVAAPGAFAAQAAPSTDVLESPRAEILAIAERYASFRWTGSGRNVLHGEDADGRRVDTADDSMHETGWHPDGRESVGMPYCWGGFTSIDEFLVGLEEGKYAGLVPTSERAFSSRFAMGLDCSGFVSRCWDLPQKQSTRSLGKLCYDLPSYDELLPGDILNKFDSHVVLFAGFADEERQRARVLEAARIKVAEAVYDVDVLRDAGFVPMRYKPLDARWVPMDSLPAEFEAAQARGEFTPDGGEEEIESIANPLGDVRRGEWARYRKIESRYEGLPLTSTRMVARRTGDAVEVQVVHRQDEKDLMRGGSRDASEPFPVALTDFAGFTEPIQDLVVVASSVETGSFALAGKSFEARRITAVLEGQLLSRHKLFPITIEVDCVQSSSVPLQGLLEAEYRMQVTYGTDGNGDSIIGRETKGFSLSAFGGSNGA